MKGMIQVTKEEALYVSEIAYKYGDERESILLPDIFAITPPTNLFSVMDNRSSEKNETN